MRKNPMLAIFTTVFIDLLGYQVPSPMLEHRLTRSFYAK